MSGTSYTKHFTTNTGAPSIPSARTDRQDRMKIAKRTVTLTIGVVPVENGEHVRSEADVSLLQEERLYALHTRSSQHAA